MLDSSTFKKFTARVDHILENLEDVDPTAIGKHLPSVSTSVTLTISILTTFTHTDDDDEIPQEFLLGKHQLSELGSDSLKIKDMGIFNKVEKVHSYSLWRSTAVILWH